MAGLQDELAKSTASAFKFNKATGTFDASTQDLYRLRQQAELTGAYLDDMLESGREMAKLDFIKSSVDLSTLDDAQQGVLAIGIDIQRFRPLAEFKKDVAKFATHLKQTPLEPGAPEIRMPGESTAINTKIRQESGITIHPVIWERLVELSENFSVKLPAPKRV